MKVKDMIFSREEKNAGLDVPDVLFTCFVGTEQRITILDRMTGFSNGFGGCLRNQESGYLNGKRNTFVCNECVDIRNHPEMEISEAIKLIKKGR